VKGVLNGKRDFMKIIFVALIAFVVVGCNTNRQLREQVIREKYGCAVSGKGLFDMTRPRSISKLKTCYEHGNNSLMQVLQVLDGGVLVSPGYSFWEREAIASGEILEKKLNVFIETSDSYVDGEYLRQGYYEYVGTYVYTTVKDARATVRKYRKLDVNIE
jgi:hypothetical protein